MNNRRLRVAARQEMIEAVIACGIPFIGRGNHPQFLAELGRRHGRDGRRAADGFGRARPRLCGGGAL